eukprot:3830329-Karenia_brevis.AAC.1
MSTPLCDQAAVEKEANTWARLWKEHSQYLATFDLAGRTPPPQLVVEQVRKAALSFPAGTGVGGDNIAPRAISRLSDALLIWLCVILTASEALGTWPTVLHLVLIVLLPKADGGQRPIGLFPTLIRIWMRARSSVARTWEHHTHLPCLFGGKGRGAQRAAWQIAFRAEAAGYDNLAYAQTLLDL